MILPGRCHVETAGFNDRRKRLAPSRVCGAPVSRNLAGGQNAGRESHMKNTAGLISLSLVLVRQSDNREGGPKSGSGDAEGSRCLPNIVEDGNQNGRQWTAGFELSGFVRENCGR
ncbi:hypothetical protein Bbelb_344570 [Branchiostoma belcheri]|nr:hypothetical protein Bbelb_344570 [Branchiostoma belcheri]